MLECVGFRRVRRIELSVLATMVGIALMGCTGRGGGVLTPATSPGFTDDATIGFSFQCERNKLHVSLSYRDQSTHPLFGGPFGIHGEADAAPSPVIRAYCAGNAQNEALDAGELVFEGVYRVQSGTLNGYDVSNCTREEKFEDPLTGISGSLTGCRFTAHVRDTGLQGPSKGDYVSITLFGGAATTGRNAVPIYSRAGTLASGNFEVDNP